MSSVKLNNRLRNAISHDMLRHRFEKEEERVGKLFFNLADDVYNDVYVLDTRLQMQSLPKGWLPKASALSVQFGAGSSNFVRLRFPNGENRVVLTKHQSSCARRYADSHILTLRWIQYGDARDALKSARGEAQTEVAAILGSVTTTKRLAEIWPQAVPFIRNHISDENRNLPSVAIAQVNALLNLEAA